MLLQGLLSALLLTGALAENDLSPDPSSRSVKNEVVRLTRHRSFMLEEESQVRQDHPFRKHMSSVCKRAEDIVEEVRLREMADVWAPNGKYPSRFPGQMFPLARPQIVKTKLFKIVRQMPKGSLLHGHHKLMVAPETIIQDIVDTEGMIFESDQPLDDKTSQLKATIKFYYASKSSIKEMKFSGTRFPMNEIDKYFPGKRAAFNTFIQNKMTIPRDQAIHHERGVNQVWELFNGAVSSIGTMLKYEPVVRKYYARLYRLLAEDNVNWAEFRGGASAGDLVLEGEEKPVNDVNAWWKIMTSELEKFQKTREGKRFWGVRVIWSDYRRAESNQLISKMTQSFERKQDYPDLIGGYDLVSQEDPGNTLHTMLPELVAYQDKAYEKNLSMPYFFHAGETLMDGVLSDWNLFDAVELGARRIGHAFSLYKHPHLMEILKKKQILVEVCPISHEVLRLTTDILHHPLISLISSGVPVAISNDDPAILGQAHPGLSFDFYQVLQAFDSIGLGGMGALAENSIRWSNFEDQTDEEWRQDIKRGAKGRNIKGHHLRQWKKEWEEYCQWIVDEKFLEGDLREDL